MELCTVNDFDLYGVQLAAGYTVSNWSNDPKVERDLKVFFGRVTKKIYSVRDLDEAVKDHFFLSEFFLESHDMDCREIEARGLGLASLLDEVAASLPSAACWRSPCIQLRREWLEADEREQNASVTVYNISQSSQAGPIADKMLQELQAVPPDRRGELDNSQLKEKLPHLRLGSEVSDHLRSLPSNVYSTVWRKLVSFDNAVRDWRRDPDAIGPSLSGVRPESESTMEQYGSQREFRDFEGRKAVFEHHVSAGKKYRIHFRLVQPKVLEVGYVGYHLPTTRYSS